MANSFPTEFLLAMKNRNVPLVLFGEIDYESEIVRVHTGVGNIQFQGSLFTGVGDVIDISGMSDDGTTSAEGIEATLDGLNQSLVNKTLDEKVIGRDVKIWAAVMQPDAKSILTSALMFSGFVSTSALAAGDDNAVRLGISSRFMRWASGLGDMFSDESQQSRHSGDKRFCKQAALATATIRWGSTVTAERFRA